MRGINKRILGALLVGATGLAACDGGSAGAGSSRLTVKLTDAPGDLAEAWVEVEQIYLQGEGGRVVLRSESTGLIDLLTLRDAVRDLVTGAAVPAGTYSEMRFVIGDAYVKTEDGRVFATQGAALPAGTQASGTLVCPSCAQTGIKVKFPDGSVSLEEETEILVVDFDVSQSFGQAAGRSGQWVMRPVLHATDFQAAGSISGTVALAAGVVLPACGGTQPGISLFVPRAVVGTDTVASGAVDSTGAYRIRYLAPGSYTMGYAPEVTVGTQKLVFTAAATPATVTVASGASTTAAYQITGATCE